ncbi:uncharacterized protein V1518DRAFT_72513 [Limtongia smithiae]|uniref:uncharacterized protein n=1 Tax=Limtongia smithiae TaxID=1125753 RepID=UPI0034CF3DCC
MSELKRIAVLGAGASGLVAAKALVEEKAFDEVVVFERNPIPGGLWNYSENIDVDIVAPSVDPKQSLPAYFENGKFVEFPGSSYESLVTNVPEDLMLFPFPEYTKKFTYFIHRSGVADFLHEYAKSLESIIKYSTNVLDVTKKDDKWVVTYQPSGSKTGKSEQKVFDAIAVATGNFNVPYIPEVDGLAEFKAKFPDKIIHSKSFRSPDSYKDKTVIVVGSAASGADISYQLAFISKKVYKSVRTEMPSYLSKPNPMVEDVKQITSFNSDDGSIVLADGRVLTGIDYVIYATGYLRSYPILKQLDESEFPLITDGSYVDNLYLHFIYVPDPSLVILGTPRLVFPFRVSQAQACYIARIWSGRLKLPPKEIMELWLWKRRKEVENPKTFHDLPFPLDADFCEFVYALCKLAPGDYGMFPRRWPNSERVLRKGAGEFKKAFTQYLEDFGKYAETKQDLLDAGLVGEMELLKPEEVEPNFAPFGIVENGDAYTEQDILAAKQEMLSISDSSTPGTGSDGAASPETRATSPEETEK